MTLITLIIQLLLTIPLTIILNYCKRKNKNKIDQILIPTIYIIILSALIPSIKENIYLIVIFEIFVRNFYITNVINNNDPDSNNVFIIQSLISVGLSILTYNYFISSMETIIPEPEEIRGFVWFLILLYIVSIYNNLTKDNKIKEKQKFTIKKKENTVMQYAKYKTKYSTVVNSKNKTINELVYSIMIYESYKTPTINRKLEEYVGAVTKKETKYGIMRQKSFNHLTDEESIKVVIEKLENISKDMNLKSENSIKELLIDYSEEEKNNIIYIYNEIVEFSKK